MGSSISKAALHQTQQSVSDCCVEVNTGMKIRMKTRKVYKEVRHVSRVKSVSSTCDSCDKPITDGGSFRCLTRCSHMFHRTCLKQPWPYSRKCPVCAVPYIDVEESSELVRTVELTRNGNVLETFDGGDTVNKVIKAVNGRQYLERA